MSEIKAGDLIRDNDPRMADRTLRVLEIRSLPGLPVLIQAQHFSGLGRVVIINRNRIFTDGKIRRYGFSLVKRADA